MTLTLPDVMQMPKPEGIVDTTVLIDAIATDPDLYSALKVEFGATAVASTVTKVQAMRDVTVEQVPDMRFSYLSPSTTTETVVQLHELADGARPLSDIGEHWGKSPDGFSGEQVDVALTALRHRASQPGHRLESTRMLAQYSPDPVERFMRGLVFKVADRFLGHTATA